MTDQQSTPQTDEVRELLREARLRVLDEWPDRSWNDEKRFVTSIDALLATPPAPVEGVETPNTEHWVKRSHYNRLYDQFDLCREVNELRTASPEQGERQSKPVGDGRG